MWLNYFYDTRMFQGDWRVRERLMWQPCLGHITNSQTHSTRNMGHFRTLLLIWRDWKSSHSHWMRWRNFFKTDISAQDAHGETALHRAAREGYTATMKLMLHLAMIKD